MTRIANGRLVKVVALLLAVRHHLDPIVVHHEGLAGVVELVRLLLLMLMMLV